MVRESLNDRVKVAYFIEPMHDKPHLKKASPVRYPSARYPSFYRAPGTAGGFEASWGYSPQLALVLARGDTRFVPVGRSPVVGADRRGPSQDVGRRFRRAAPGPFHRQAVHQDSAPDSG